MASIFKKVKVKGHDKVDKDEEKKASKKKEGKDEIKKIPTGQEGQLAIDVYQTEKELVIQSTIAGVRPADLDISIENDMVTIRGEREKPSEGGKGINYLCQECFWGSFSRDIILPEETDPSRAKASLRRGVLVISLPRIQRREKRKIIVKA